MQDSMSEDERIDQAEFLSTTAELQRLSEELERLKIAHADTVAPPVLLAAVRLVQSKEARVAGALPLTEELRSRIEALVGHVKVDLHAPLDPTDD